MSVMPARTPSLSPIPSKSRTMRKLALVKPILKPIISPIAEAIPVVVPQGRASTRTFSLIILVFPLDYGVRLNFSQKKGETLFLLF